jgi:hypothetical protein
MVICALRLTSQRLNPFLSSENRTKPPLAMQHFSPNVKGEKSTCFLSNFLDFLQNGGEINNGVWCIYWADFRFDWWIFVADHLKHYFAFFGTLQYIKLPFKFFSQNYLFSNFSNYICNRYHFLVWLVNLIVDNLKIFLVFLEHLYIRLSSKIFAKNYLLSQNFRALPAIAAIFGTIG